MNNEKSLKDCVLSVITSLNDLMTNSELTNDSRSVLKINRFKNWVQTKLSETDNSVNN